MIKLPEFSFHGFNEQRRLTRSVLESTKKILNVNEHANKIPLRFHMKEIDHLCPQFFL
jgi:hypothetical protein